MRKGKRPIILTSVLVMTVGAIFFAGKPLFYAQEEAPLSKQDAPFKTYTLGVYCRGPLFPTAGFFYTVPEKAMGNKELCAGKCGGSSVSLADALAQLPGAVAAAFREQVARHLANAAAGKAPPLPCLSTGKEPPDEKKPKCETPSKSPVPPWLDPDAPCPEWSIATIGSKRSNWLTKDLSFIVNICGEVIRFQSLGAAGATSDLILMDTRSFPVCCDAWRKAVKTKKPCDARQDIDCDNNPNTRDRFPDIAEDNRTSLDFFVPKLPTTPPNTDAWTQLHPPRQSECSNCKWELVNYVYTCKNIPNYDATRRFGKDVFDGEYHFTALWKCPSTGQTKPNDEIVTVHATGCL